VRQSRGYERTLLGIAVTITAVWALATIVQVFIPSRVVPSYANLLMMTVAGAFFGGAMLASKRRPD
jgi:hypothetical protein